MADARFANAHVVVPLKQERAGSHLLLAKAVVDPLQIAAAFLNEDGTILCTNKLWADWAAALSDKADSKNLLSVVAPEARDQATAYFAAPGSEGASLLAVSDAHEIDVVQHIGDGAWKPGFICLVRPHDGTSELAELKLRWHHTLEGKNRGVWDFNYATKTWFFSRGWAALRGFDPDDLSRREHDAWLSRVHPNDQDIVLTRRNAMLRGDTDTIFEEYRERHADGQWIWIMSQGTVAKRDDQGQPQRIIGVDTNITHLKIGADKHEERSRRLQLAMSASEFGLWEYDMARNRVSWDQNTRAIYGLNSAKPDWPAEIWDTFIHPEDLEDTLAIANQALIDKEDYDLFFRIRRPDGAVRHLRSRATMVTNMEGKTNILGITWDVTAETESANEIKTAYAVIRQHNQALEEAHAEMEYRSLHDALTGLANRRKLDLFVRGLTSGQGSKRRCAVLHIDLDRFKTINDTLGHGAGDAVLKRAADILSEAAPPNSIVARIGGDEFAILIADVSHDAMVGHWANEIIKQSEKPIQYAGHHCRFGMSIGIAIDFCDARTADALFSNADLALYQAKDAGRGVMRFFTEDLKIAAFEKRQRSDEIIYAIENQEFCCYYQPQYDRTGQTITGLEALARWNHSTHGILSPDHFIDIASELGVIGKIDEQILECALSDAKCWIKAGKRVPKVSVNVSGKRLLDPHLPDRISHLADCAHPLAFELLETIFLDDQDPCVDANLARIREMGISIEIDDFGSGHASVVGLLNLRPDRIKIDRQLIMPVTQSQQAKDLVKSMVYIGKAMGTPIVAEGVETDDHVRILQELGCDYLQGYGLCRPVPQDTICAMLSDL